MVRKWSDPVDLTANYVVAVPGGAEGPGGVLVCSENWIVYKNVRTPALPLSPAHFIQLLLAPCALDYFEAGEASTQTTAPRLDSACVSQTLSCLHWSDQPKTSVLCAFPPGRWATRTAAPQSRGGPACLASAARSSSPRPLTSRRACSSSSARSASCSTDHSPRERD